MSLIHLLTVAHVIDIGNKGDIHRRYRHTNTVISKLQTQ